MWEIVTVFAIFVISLAVLIKSSDFFTEAAEKIGIILGFSPFIIGVTIVSIGTSLPELISSLFAIWEGSSEIILGTVVGSNIANIFLIVGIASVICKKTLTISYDLVSVDLPLFVGSAFLLSLIVQDGHYRVYEALLLIAAYILYIIYTARNSREELTVDTEVSEKSSKLLSREFIILLIAGVGIFLGARFTIFSVIRLSEMLGVAQELIAISFVAIGTSLPELAVTISAARKGRPEIAIGNVLGSNIFNSFMVMGIPRFFGGFMISEAITERELFVMLGGTLLLFFATQDKKMTRWEGGLFLIFYAWFIGKIFESF
ncbi:calcium/sodium antiporter [Spirulina sp. CS-785/01]|uniref:calcium/sodium antiporter n=1 Tax=Spirulina sp. CS-785/01 TaxID=3021716 RepID=UPI00232FB33C|nr:calcium/sodium antiporter [Spirulina sp. CS-785/01]MDB9314117.1 calcium/sodium antiporter [Spirulina sp. CS-785/01]